MENMADRIKRIEAGRRFSKELSEKIKNEGIINLVQYFLNAVSFAATALSEDKEDEDVLEMAKLRHAESAMLEVYMDIVEFEQLPADFQVQED